MKKKKMYIHGSFMNDNYGDFLLYYIVDKISREFEQKIEIFSADIHGSYDNYCKINRKSKFKGIFFSDMVVFAGGGYLGEPDKRKIYWNLRCLFKHLIPAYIISKRKIPYAIIGVETGPLSFKISKKILKRICENATVVSVRNEQSKEFLKDIKVNREILVNPDWVMGVESNMIIKNDETAKNILNSIDKNKNKIFVHLTTKNNEEDVGMKNVIDDLKKFAKSRNDIFYIVGCDQKRTTQEERALEICKNFSENQCMILKYQGPWTLSYILNEVDAIITDKLHVGIVGVKCGKEVISVASHNKSVKFHKLIGREEWTQHLTTIKSGDTLGKLEKLTFKNIEIDKRIFNDAKNNEKILKEFIITNIG